jgi:hypothetical protein
MDVVDRIGETATGASGPFKSDAPVKPVIIEKVEILGASSAPPVSTPTPVTPSPGQDSILSPK